MIFIGLSLLFVCYTTIINKKVKILSVHIDVVFLEFLRLWIYHYINLRGKNFNHSLFGSKLILKYFIVLSGRKLQLHDLIFQ